jgi:hypothetical protein
VITAESLIVKNSDRVLKESLTRSGLVKIGMVSGGVQHTRSVALLVATSFVIGRDEIFDTPIHLDGDPQNNHADNLVWRPRWFAWKYTRQFSDDKHQHRGPLLDITTGVWYLTMLEAATTHGLLMDDIWKSVIHKQKVFPTWQIFSFKNKY